MSSNYTLRYLPLFEQDVAAVKSYISLVLHNPSAATRLIDLVEQAILKRLENPLAFEAYHSAKEIYPSCFNPNT